jgi:hypothetical protein
MSLLIRKFKEREARLLTHCLVVCAMLSTSSQAVGSGRAQWLGLLRKVERTPLTVASPCRAGNLRRIIVTCCSHFAIMPRNIDGAHNQTNIARVLGRARRRARPA